MSSRRSKLTRRALIAGGGILGCCVLVSGGGAATYFLTTRPESNVGDLDFSTPLAIPPLLEGDLDGEGRRAFDLTVQAGQTRIVPSGQAGTWGVNGPFLGRTLRARRGETVAIAVHNELPEETTIHWHGMHLPARMDGGPHQMIAVGESWNPTWTIDQPAATLWYHPHPHGQTAEHVYRGVAGCFLVDDDETDAAGLPHEYGVDDFPLIVQDKKFTDDGDLSLDAGSFLDQLGGSTNFGILGDTILVNGTWNPFLEVTRSRVRFRILNASNARFYNLGFNDDRSFYLVATGNGLIPGAPIELNRLPLGPSERAEIVVELTRGDTPVMRSFKVDLGDGGRQLGANDTWDILQVRAASDLADSPVLPDTLGETNAAPELPDDATSRDIEFQGHQAINGEKMEMARIDQVIPAGALERWTVRTSGQPHTFHIHGATFHVIEVEGGEPEAHLRGPKDTVFVGPEHEVTLAVRFGSYVDPDFPYMYHCHILRHEDNGMMGQFVVVEPGTEDDVDRTLDLHDHH
jgi:FtsP/CotA-like multicopper oxidase with cupredoxin domain